MMRMIAACLILLAPPAGASTWIVDASGAGHFTSIQAAIDAVAPGDVLLVEPGTYGAFTLGKDLAILGPASGPLPFVPGESLLLMESAEVAALRFGTLEIVGASGVVLLDQVEIDGNLAGLAGCDGARIEDCAQVHIARSTVLGRNGDPSCESRALGIADSTVTLTDCIVQGGTGWGDDFYGYPGVEGLDIGGDSLVILARTSVFGGHGGSPVILFGGVGGDGAEAIRMNWGDPAAPAACQVLGQEATLLQGGKAGGGIGAMDAPVAVSGFGSFVVSGVSLDPPNLGSQLDVQLPVPAQPFIHLTGEDGPGAYKRLSLHGPAGTPLLLFASFDAAQFSVPGPVDGTIWLDLSTAVLVLPFVLFGQEDAVNLTFTLPASLVGLEGADVAFQGFAQGLGGSGNHLATNPAHLLIR